jgi:hypothetical protein
MKKRVLLAVLIFAGLSGLTASCEILDECGTCEQVIIDANDNETRTTPLPYCGEDLKSKKDSSPETVGGITTYWECY